MDFFTLEGTETLFLFLEKCKGVVQNKEWHPEGDVFTHSVQVGAMAFKETFDIDLILAAYFHDVGKIEGSYGHADLGCNMLYPYVSVKTLFLIEHHMRIRSYLNGDMKKYSKCKFILNHPWFNELIQLCRWDNMGRNPNAKPLYDRSKIINKLNMYVDKHFYLPPHMKDSEEKTATLKF